MGELLIGSNIDKDTIDVECPKCKTANKVIIKQIQLGKIITCCGCKETIQLIDKNGGAEKLGRKY